MLEYFVYSFTMGYVNGVFPRCFLIFTGYINHWLLRKFTFTRRFFLFPLGFIRWLHIIWLVKDVFGEQKVNACLPFQIVRSPVNDEVCNIKNIKMSSFNVFNQHGLWTINIGLTNFNTYSKTKQLKFVDPYSTPVSCPQLMFLVNMDKPIMS